MITQSSRLRIRHYGDNDGDLNLYNGFTCRISAIPVSTTPPPPPRERARESAFCESLERGDRNQTVREKKRREEDLSPRSLPPNVSREGH